MLHNAVFYQFFVQSRKETKNPISFQNNEGKRHDKQNLQIVFLLGTQLRNLYKELE